MKPGDRVVAFSHKDWCAVYFFGHGIYEGDFVPGEEAGGSYGTKMRELGTPVPRIKLDNGEFVYDFHGRMMSPEDLLSQFPLVNYIHVDLSKLYKSIRRFDE